MALPFPAVLIDESALASRPALTATLSCALVQRGIRHYALHLTPAGALPPDDESTRVTAPAPQADHEPLVEFVARICRMVQRRHLPLLVDPGALPAEALARIAPACTHLVAATGAPGDAIRRYALLAEPERLAAAVLRRQEQLPAPPGDDATASDGTPRDPAVAALLEDLVRLFLYDQNELYRAHIGSINVDLVINVERAIYPLPAHQDRPWLPAELPILLASLPGDEPLALYGRAPGWIFAALAAWAAPADCLVFDELRGWLELPAAAAIADLLDPFALHIEQREQRGDYTYLRCELRLRSAAAGALPGPALDQGVVIAGALPNWLWAALARAYTAAAWLACVTAPSAPPVVVYSQQPDLPVGSLPVLAGLDAIGFS